MPKGKRNKALDCRVYGMDALYILNPNLDRLAKEREREQLRQPGEQEVTEAPTSKDWMGY